MVDRAVFHFIEFHYIERQSGSDSLLYPVRIRQNRAGMLDVQLLEANKNYAAYALDANPMQAYRRRVQITYAIQHFVRLLSYFAISDRSR